jgi:hypothetical protein
LAAIIIAAIASVVTIKVMPIGNSGTTIRIKDEVHDRLAQVGHWNESMSDIINRLIDEHYELERMLKGK